MKNRRTSRTHHLTTWAALFFALCAARPAYIHAQQEQKQGQNVMILTQRLPHMQKLSHTDLLFRQFAETVRHNERMLSADHHDELILEFYVYTAQKNDDLLFIAADTGIPYDTIATLNALENADAHLNGKTLVIPTVRGIFIAKKPQNNFEILINQENAEKYRILQKTCYTIGDRIFYFAPGERLSGTQRAFFLDTSIKMPLDKMVISSGFGYRNSPVYKEWKFHKGIDLAANEGESVYACKSGTVLSVLKMDPTFGNCVILSHDNGMTSVYAHLLDVFVKKGEHVGSGSQIGLVGQTGLATGPHLHFEIRQNGTATDPQPLLRSPH